MLTCLVLFFSNTFCRIAIGWRTINIFHPNLDTSNERSEDSYIGLADFFLGFFFGKRLKILMHLGIYAFFEFN